MSRTGKILVAALVVVILLATFLLRNRASPLPNNGSSAPLPTAASAAANSSPSKKTLAGDSTAPQAAPIVEPALQLTAASIEELAPLCFQGKACEFAEDPWEMYQNFRRSQHPNVCDLIISLMRKNMGEPEFREKYKGVLLSMIEDFYLPREIEFQVAAYYAYLGELEKSLRLYQTLEKHHVAEPSIRRAPPLNIANVLYDLKRKIEALPYYEKALAELKAAPETLTQQRDLVQFIEQRIAEIKAEVLTSSPQSTPRSNIP